MTTLITPKGHLLIVSCVMKHLWLNGHTCGIFANSCSAMVPPPPFHIDYAGFQVQEQLPNAEQLFANMPPSSINEDDKKTKSKTKSPKKTKNNSKTSQ